MYIHLYKIDTKTHILTKVQYADKYAPISPSAGRNFYTLVAIDNQNFITLQIPLNAQGLSTIYECSSEKNLTIALWHNTFW